MPSQNKLLIVPLHLREANKLVAQWHRHHKPVQGYKFAVGVVCVPQVTGANAGEVVGAAIVGRPVSRHLDDGFTLEVTRCVTNGTPNACSALYGACWRVAREMGYRKVITYTLASETGVSMKATGWKCIGERGGSSWNVPSRPRVDKAPTCQKMLWERSA